MMELQAQEKHVLENARRKIPPGLPPSDIYRIQRSFRMVVSQGEKMASRFYDLLLERSPELQKFFHPGNLSQQHAKFFNGLHSLMLHLEHPQALRAALVQLGEQHQGYGIEIQHYPPVVDTLLQVLTEFSGEGMDGETYDAWANFLHLVRAIMLENLGPDVSAEDENGMSHSTMIAEKPKRILLIDDDHQLLDLYQSYLEIQGYLCSQVSDVAWAFTHLLMSHYDVVLTDFQMPLMNGIQLRKNLDYMGKGLWPPFILVTGSLNQEIRKQALESGFVAVLKKPHDLTELGSIIRIAVKKSWAFPGNEGYLNRAGDGKVG
ncbi:MAG: response regulator [Nitrospirota bacterium]|nr:response regulator [Nitrospirota bacterium]